MGKYIVFFFNESWLLIVSSFFFGLILAVTNAAWQPRIVQNEIDKFNNLAGAMLSQAESFETALADAQIKSAKGKLIKTEIKKALDANGQLCGWAFVCQGPGFADNIKLVLTIDAGFDKLLGYGVLSSNETPGFGDKIKNDYFKDQFIDAPATKLELLKTGEASVIDSNIIAITGATIRSQAVVDILNTYISQDRDLLQSNGLITSIHGNDK